MLRLYSWTREESMDHNSFSLCHPDRSRSDVRSEASGGTPILLHHTMLYQGILTKALSFTASRAHLAVRRLELTGEGSALRLLVKEERQYSKQQV
jgi:hypothetical protein